MTSCTTLRAAAAPLFLSAVFAACAFHAAPAQARTICTLVADAADGRVLAEQGACGERYTPASTFKIAISLMGFDAGILQDENTPAWNFQPGYPDWGGEEWRKPATPARWIKYSIVWYSQQVARRLGQARFQEYTSKFHFGNEDVSGEPGKNDGVDGAWIISSLRISPREQVDFMRKIVNRQLPVSAHAYDMTTRILDQGLIADGWRLYGKTGAGSPGSDGHYDASLAYGWFVGWMEKDGRKVAFARLIQDEKATTPSPGLRARASLVEALPGLVAAGSGAK
ncbi:class D beta-lactamase [Achromobacter aloeverae]|uniref:Beta-lactamase n=1 Tax=Achromobacter aloeverae TaxID=1750518 RepID=A0A4Q1HFB8_9BURK|nr:class D beta-lactamase [Achromobacter aloeverae]RXN85319.1 class D beta-lactamase [Achromobacter aloeverae]